MAETKSLLRQIRDKETDLDRALDQAALESQHIVEAAQKEAEEIVRNAEKEGGAAAAEYLRKEREKLGQEITALKEKGRSDTAAVRVSAEARMPGAAEKIVKAVALR
jgi:vacuolar-type H+-ATPase subunit H